MLSKTPANETVTVLLKQWQDGCPAALDQLLPQVYTDLRRIATRQLRRYDGHATLQATALVNEVLLRLLDRKITDFTSTAHLLNASAQMMRQHLVNRARIASREKHGNGWQRDELAQAMQLPIPDGSDIIDLDAALTDLENYDERMARVVELRYFIGLGMAQIGHVLNTTERTVHRDWRLALAWLHERLDA